MIYIFKKTDENNKLIHFYSINELLEFEYIVRLKHDLEYDDPNEFDEILETMKLENYEFVETYR